MVPFPLATRLGLMREIGETLDFVDDVVEVVVRVEIVVADDVEGVDDAEVVVAAAVAVAPSDSQNCSVFFSDSDYEICGFPLGEADLEI